ncbi:MAG: hypothetical protein IPO62_04545 [Saprospiraceae bacterium]|nr:hypothetical protein [Saprospiraceae bacterium]
MNQVFKPLPYIKSSDLVVMLNWSHFKLVNYLISKGIVDTKGNVQPGYKKWIYKINLQFFPWNCEIFLTPIGQNGIFNWILEDDQP